MPFYTYFAHPRPCDQTTLRALPQAEALGAHAPTCYAAHMTDTPQKPFRKPWLPMRLRKLIGLVAMLALIIFYALIVMTIAVTTSVPENGIVEFFYYLITGIAWVVPAGAIIYWMQRPDEPQ